MDRSRIEAELAAIIRTVFGRANLTVERSTTPRDVPGWDSFKTVEIVLAAEEHFKMEFEVRDVDRFRCVGDLVDAIADKV